MKRAAVLILLLAFSTTGCVHLDRDSTKIVGISQLEDDTIELVWLSRKSATYEILSSDDPTADEADWKVEATVTADSSKTTSWIDTEASSTKKKLYRVRRVKELN